MKVIVILIIHVSIIVYIVLCEQVACLEAVCSEYSLQFFNVNKK